MTQKIQNQKQSEDQRMIIQAEILFVVARKGIFRTQLCIHILNRNIMVSHLQVQTLVNILREEAVVGQEKH